MYKLLLSWRYLLTRFIALASITSVTLGVGAMIVVNAVMLGFTTEMENRIHGMLSDVIFKVRNLEGIPDPEGHIKRIMEIAGNEIEGITPTVISLAFLQYRCGDEYMTQQVQLIGIDEETQGSVSTMSQYLQHPENRRQISFLLKENGYDVASPDSRNRQHLRPELGDAGWSYRRITVAERERNRRLREEMRRQIQEQERAERERLERSLQPQTPIQQEQEPGELPFPSPYDPGPLVVNVNPNESTETGVISEEVDLGADPFAIHAETDRRDTFDPAKEQHTGVILGMGLALYDRTSDFDSTTGTSVVEDTLFLRPGDDVVLMFPTAGRNIKAAQDVFTVVDLFESKMVDQDTRFVFVPIRKLQQLKGMIDPETGIGRATEILIKAKPGVNLDQLRDKIRAAFPGSLQLAYSVQTWRDVQGSLLSAVFTEIALLNVLLFLVFVVAGFGILAIFYMIVVEKTRDIGILKSLGASGLGIAQIFLLYSLSLGLLGAGVGVIGGLIFVAYINEIASVLARIMGHEVFDPAIYSFSEIPTIVQPGTIIWIVLGAVFIAICSGVLPAFRAARLKPVESLRS
ncbi:MAG: FtsX-like permease family protein [Thermoguttaceae bacterium]